MKPRLLVLELWGFGDLVIATPFLQAATEKFEVTLVAKSFATELQPRFWPEVEVIPFNAPWTAFQSKYQLWRWPWQNLFQLRKQLRVRQFTYGVSARWDPRDHLALKLSGAEERFGFPRLKSHHYLTQNLPQPPPLAHRYQYWCGLGDALGLKLPAQAALFPSPQPRPPLVLIHSGARLQVRVWPLKNFWEIAQRFRQQNINVQIICDADQLEWWQSRGEHVQCPQTVAGLLSLLDQGGVFIGNDSGPGHLAAACGLPTFTLFGPQLHEWFAPMHAASEVLEGRACPYKPCSDYCRFATPFCLAEVTVDEAWSRMEKFVSRLISPTQTTPGLSQ